MSDLLLDIIRYVSRLHFQTKRNRVPNLDPNLIQPAILHGTRVRFFFKKYYTLYKLGQTKLSIAKNDIV